MFPIRLTNTKFLPIALAAAMGLAGAQVLANDDDDDDGDRGRFCSTTASLQYRACKHELGDDFFEAQAICLQIPERAERDECFQEARTERGDGRQLCRDQRAARRELCGGLGEGRYAPDFDPENFDDDFRKLTNPNPYYPLQIGNFWEYQTTDETNRIEVFDKTKLIEGVTCIVVNDFVTKAEGGGEDTDDWYAQRKDGTVDYCGESSRDLEVFEGDDPPEPELVEIEGSFKAGRDGDLPGTIFLASPEVGMTYRQEWSAGNAEDAATIVSTTYGFGNDPELDEFMPQELAELLCNNDCVVTGEVVPLEPDVFELKFYARDIGLFFEVKPEDGETNRLVGCNSDFDPRCADLPAL